MLSLLRPRHSYEPSFVATGRAYTYFGIQPRFSLGEALRHRPASQSGLRRLTSVRPHHAVPQTRNAVDWPRLYCLRVLKATVQIENHADRNREVGVSLP
jgi:hypothetical protein